jgi:branched-chain amino acid transport system permease protein
MAADAPIPRLDLAGAFRATGFTALVACGLYLPLIGFETVTNINDQLTLRTRWPLFFTAVAVTAAARFAYALAIRPWLLRRAYKPAQPVRAWRLYLKKWFVAFAVGFVVAYPVIVILVAGWGSAGKWIDNFGIQILIYMMLGWGLNIVVGLAGLLDLGYVAFYAVGAYSYALLAKNFGLSFWILLPLAGILSSFWGILLGFPVLRLRGDYLAIVTLGFGEIIRLILLNWQDLTGGPNGISGIPRPSFFGLPFNSAGNGFAATFGLPFSPTHRVVFLYYLILGLALLTNWVTLRLRRLPIGRAWEALREDEIACRALGINTTTTKLTAFAMGAMFGGFAGAFFATRQGFISPESFTFGESALVLAIVVLGGMGSQLGVAIAATVMLGGFEFFREFAQYRMLVFGAAMVAIVIFRPRGLVSRRTPSILLLRQAAVAQDVHVETPR